ncbi:hypothetical protein QUF80_12940 [Desulfococcaceae bacterium HSG8]|nr:hypothetical protein [Desulfococcaceae bacterium HSG8]
MTQTKAYLTGISLFPIMSIYDHPTPGRNSYMVLSFDFSGINTQTLADANEGFAEEVRQCVRLFSGRYREHISSTELKQVLGSPKPNDTLSALFRKIEEKNLGRCVYVMNLKKLADKAGIREVRIANLKASCVEVRQSRNTIFRKGSVLRTGIFPDAEICADDIIGHKYPLAI